MKQFTTQGIILTRTDFGEADRILTFITPDHGKVKAIAKGVRKSKAKLAGAVELFSVSELTMVVGRGEINTLISARLARHYGQIVKDIDRTNAAYEVLRILNKATEDKTEQEYFELLDMVLAAFDDTSIEVGLTELWFRMQLLKIAGHSPNLHSDVRGAKLSQSGSYDFQHERMHFVPKLVREGQYNTDQIKFLRLGFAARSPGVLQRVQGAQGLAEATRPLVHSMLQTYVRV